MEILNNLFEHNSSFKGADYSALMVKDYSLIKNCTFKNSLATSFFYIETIFGKFIVEDSSFIIN